MPLASYRRAGDYAPYTQLGVAGSDTDNRRPLGMGITLVARAGARVEPACLPSEHNCDADVDARRRSRASIVSASFRTAENITNSDTTGSDCFGWSRTGDLGE
jgi:hypothetical protein